MTVLTRIRTTPSPTTAPTSSTPGRPGRAEPARRRRRRGQLLLDAGRHALPRLLQPARQREHRPSAPQARRRDQGAGRPAVHRSRRSTPTTPRSEAARLIAEAARPGDLTWCSSPTAAPRPPRTRCGWPACTPAATRCSPHYRSYHGATAGAITLTGDPRRWPSEPGMPGVVNFWGPYVYRSAVPLDQRGRGVRARARAPATTC